MNWYLPLFILLPFTTKAQQLKLKLNHVVNNTPMVLNTEMYQNAAGDTFNITTFKYYLSNFTFTDTKGNIVKTQESCYLINEDSIPSKEIILKVPAGRYNSISFMIGVDSLLNCSGAQDGALDPLFGMFWTWNTGYIMAKLEGTSPSSKLPNHTIQFHIGGYRKPHITQRIVTLQLPEPLIIQQGTTPSISLTGDACSWFTGISFRQIAGFMTPGTPADRIADNYQRMFSVKEVSN